jgi:D-arabinose 1-dehydrogenase-like Zn-dependent alcohol dehydrogenase
MNDIQIMNHDYGIFLKLPGFTEPAAREAFRQAIAQHGITADIGLISIDKINEAWARPIDADVKYRFAIDMASLPPAV